MWTAKGSVMPMQTRFMGRDAVRRAVGTLLTALRVMFYSLLALLEPVIVWGAMVAALIGVALLVFFGLIVHAPHFPTALVFAMTGGSALALVGYYALMALLLPEE